MNFFTATVTYCEGTSREGGSNNWRALTFRTVWRVRALSPAIEYETTHGENEVEVLIDVLRKCGINVTNHETKIEEFPYDEITGSPACKVTKEKLELDVLHASQLDVYEIWRLFLEEMRARKFVEQTVSEYVSNWLVTDLKETTAHASAGEQT